MTWTLARASAMGVVAVVALAGPAAAQGYRATIDVRAQSVAYRGWQLDSILATETEIGPTGGFVTPDGIATTCPAGLTSGQCFYYRPGARQQAAPMVVTSDLAMWGFGIQGLSARANLRFNYDLGDEVWPNMEPTLQLYEGYLDYQARWFALRGGRQIVTTRLGWAGFDGGQATLRVPKYGVDVAGFAGWGLARASAVGINSQLTAPLGDFIPPERHLLVGAYGNLRTGPADFRLDWQRQFDLATDYLISDMVSASTTIRPARRFAITGGVDYDLAQGRWGSADASLRYTAPRVQVTGGYRRYLPRFDLYSVWAAFSPVPWNGVHASLIVSPLSWLQLRGRGEYIKFEAAYADTPLFDARDDGYRTSFGGTVTAVRNFIFDAGYNLEKVTGAWISGADASVGWTPSETLRFRVFGAYAQRPLEYRYDASTAKWIGLDADARVADRFTVGVSLVQMYEERDRPDNAAFDWDQTRLSARLTYTFSSREKDTRGLPDAVKRMPSSQGYQR
jgi:hypothetical protein